MLMLKRKEKSEKRKAQWFVEDVPYAYGQVPFVQQSRMSHMYKAHSAQRTIAHA
jgi:hypothetical protein